MATLNDHIAIYGMYRDRKILPKTIIICLDDWQFSKKNGAENWRTLQKEYVSTIKLFLATQDKEEIGFEKFYKLKKYFQLFSPQYFHTSFFDAITGNKYNYYPTNQPLLEKGASKLFDGSFVYNDAVRQRTVQQTNAMTTAAAVKISKDEVTYNLSPKVREKFEAFINFILFDGVEIVFFLLPFHPKYFEQFSRSSDKLDKIERYVQNFAAQKEIKILGSYDPMKATCTEEDFFDEGHLKDSGLVKVFKKHQVIKDY